MHKKGIWCVDIGGSSVKYGVWIQNQLIPLNSFSSPATWNEMKNKLAFSFSQTSQHYELCGISFSLPGIVNQTTGYLEGASSLRYLHGFSFREEMQQLFGLPISMENDANCATIAELELGSGKEYSDLIFMIIGTGVGGTIVNNRMLRLGAHQFSGEFGMMLVNGYQSLSELGSAVWMARKVEDQKKLVRGTLSGADVFQLAEEGDKIAKNAVEELYHYLAVGIYNLQYVYDPEVIILGGGISQKVDIIKSLYQALDKIIEVIPHSPIYPVIKTCTFHNDANLIGAALHFEEEQQKRN